jgi:hypothetical protein
VLAVRPKKTSFSVEIEFLDPPDTGRIDRVPATRLRVPWDEVAGFDERMANWSRLGDLDLDDTEQSAVETVYERLIPTAVANWEWNPVRLATAVHESAALTGLIGTPLEAILEQCESFVLERDLMISPTGTLLIAEAACRANPIPILDWVIAEEERLREKVKRGGLHVVARKEVATSPEWEYRWYRVRDRPLHELLRHWCGHRAVTFQERLLAAEAENHRLDVLLAAVLDALRQSGADHVAVMYEEEHERDRTTPERARPVVDRPLSPAEIPVRYERARRRWW